MVEQELLFKQKLPIKVLSGGPEILQKLLLLILLAPAPDFLLLIPLRWNTARWRSTERANTRVRFVEGSCTVQAIFGLPVSYTAETMSLFSLYSVGSFLPPRRFYADGVKIKALRGRGRGESCKAA